MKIIQVQYASAQGILYGLGDDGTLYRYETLWDNETRKYIRGWVTDAGSDDIIG